MGTSNQRFSLIASVGDLGLFGGLATTPRRLAGSAAVATAVLLAYAAGNAEYVLHRSRSVELNVVLISVQALLVLAAAYVQAMWVGSRMFGDAWRRRTFLGERPEAGPDDVDVASLRDYSLHFYGIFAATAVASYAAVVLVTGDYVGTYNAEGYYATLLRSDDAARRIEAVRGLADPVREASAQRRALREQLVEALQDPDAEVRAWAAWTSGHLQVIEAAPGLVGLLERGTAPERVEAALALGRLRDPDGERRIVGMLPSTVDDPDVATALVVALGLMPSTDALPTLTALLGAVAPDVEVALLWAIGRTRATSAREPILSRWETSEGRLRCALAETLKHVTTIDDYDRMRRAFSEEPRGVVCDGEVYEGRQLADGGGMPAIELVMAEELRLKYAKAAFNIGGPGLEEWLIAIAYDDRESVPMRVGADRLAELLRTSPARLPRR